MGKRDTVIKQKNGYCHRHYFLKHDIENIVRIKINLDILFEIHFDINLEHWAKKITNMILRVGYD